MDFDGGAPLTLRRIYGISEIANELGLERKTVSQWRSRGKLPPADDVLSMGPVWLSETIEPWITKKKKELAFRNH